MIVPGLLVLVSAASLVAALVLPGLSDLVLVAGPALLASLIVLILRLLRPPARPRPQSTTPAPAPARAYVVVDGSNVMHWKDNTPSLETLREVVAALQKLGYTPGIVFDANAGYKLEGRYRHDGALARALHLPEDRIMVVPKGTQADELILAAARDLDARIVSNDRFRDRAEGHPEVLQPGHLIRGGYRDGKLWLEG